MAYVAVTYLKAIPTSGNNLFLIVGCAAIGAMLGGLAARFTTVHVNGEGIPVAKAGLLAAALWILGTGGRLAFQLYASHGGGSAIEHFSVAHSISAATAWTAALILMAISEATVRTGVLAWRGHAVRRQHQLAQAPPAFALSPAAQMSPSQMPAPEGSMMAPVGAGRS